MGAKTREVSTEEERRMGGRGVLPAWSAAETGLRIAGRGPDRAVEFLGSIADKVPLSDAKRRLVRKVVVVVRIHGVVEW